MRAFKTVYVVFVILALLCSASYAAEFSLPPTIVSPEAHSDGRVTFRLLAPDAKRVGVNVQFVQGFRPMTKSENGVWSVTLGPAEPEIYEYNFVVDGLQVVDPSNSWLKVWLGNARNLVEIHDKEPMFFQEQEVPHGTVHIHKYHSKSLGVTRGLYIYTPPGYETSKNAKYPVLYLFHGMGDCVDAWTVVGRANVIVDNLLAKNKAKPLVIVMPYGHTPSTPDSDMRSIGNYAAFEKDLIKDVIPYVQERYRVSNKRNGRAVAGLSMGGGQSLTVGLGNPELFGWVGAFSSAVPQAPQLDGLLTKLKKSNDKLNLFWIGCGRGDFLFQTNQKFIERLKAENIEHIACITDGGHEWRLWRLYLNEFVPILFKDEK
ncbi:MAG: alpha/beta hydrolase-fold protein [Phycisphaerales bacterium]|jgi:enterochelin esterase family protein